MVRFIGQMNETEKKTSFCANTFDWHFRKNSWNRNWNCKRKKTCRKYIEHEKKKIENKNNKNWIVEHILAMNDWMSGNSAWPSYFGATFMQVTKISVIFFYGFLCLSLFFLCISLWTTEKFAVYIHWNGCSKAHRHFTQRFDTKALIKMIKKGTKHYSPHRPLFPDAGPTFTYAPTTVETRFYADSCQLKLPRRPFFTFSGWFFFLSLYFKWYHFIPSS